MVQASGEFGRTLCRPAVLVFDDGPRIGILLIERCLNFEVPNRDLKRLSHSGLSAEAPPLGLPRVETGSGDGGDDDDDQASTLSNFFYPLLTFRTTFVTGAPSRARCCKSF
jgi:hypothetical protein